MAAAVTGEHFWNIVTLLLLLLLLRLGASHKPCYKRQAAQHKGSKTAAVL
jgi:hypothetical protein